MNELFETRMTKNMGRGIFALEDIPPQKNILSVDYHTYITYSVLAHHCFFGILTQQKIVIDKKAHFAFYMAFAEQYKKHQITQNPGIVRYISKLPTLLHSLILWDEKQMSALKDKELLEKAKQKRSNLEGQFNEIQQFLVDNKQQNFIPNYQSDFSFSESEQFQESDQDEKQPENDIVMNSTSQSEEQNELRQAQSDSSQVVELDFNQFKSLCSKIRFQSSWDLKSEMGALISVLELFNHSPNGQIEKKTYHLETTLPIKKDQQIFANYGAQSNSELLFTYGCVIDEHFEKVKNEFVEECTANKEFITEEEVSKQRLSLAQRYNQLYEQEQNLNQRQAKLACLSSEAFQDKSQLNV